MTSIHLPFEIAGRRIGRPRTTTRLREAAVPTAAVAALAFVAAGLVAGARWLRNG